MPYSDDNKRFMGATKVGTKGQIVIPKEVRDMFSIKPGDTLVILADSEKGIVIQNVESLVALTDSVFDRKSRSSDVVSSIKDVKAFAAYADEICLLFGLKGQTLERMQRDVELGLRYFERICINIMVENSTKIKPDEKVITLFRQNLYEKYKNNSRVDILMENTEFGVGDKYEL